MIDFIIHCPVCGQIVSVTGDITAQTCDGCKNTLFVQDHYHAGGYQVTVRLK